MEFFVKKGRTWKTAGRITPDKYTLCYGDELGAKSEIVWKTAWKTDAVVPGDVILSGDYLGVVTGVEVKNNEIRIICGGAESWFDRETRYLPAGSTLEEQLTDLLIREFTQQADETYRLPYISVTAEPATNGITVASLMQLDNKAIYSAKDAIAEAWLQYGVELAVVAKNDAVHITVRKNNGEHHNVILGDGRNQLISRSYGGAIVEKATIYAVDKDGVLLAEQDFYYTQDGEIKTAPEAVRMYGSWEMDEIRYSPDKQDQPTLDEQLRAAAVKLMADNAKDHAIEMRSTADHKMGDRLTVLFENGEIIRTRVTAVYRDRSDTRTLYRMGTLPVTLAQKIRRGVL